MVARTPKKNPRPAGATKTKRAAKKPLAAKQVTPTLAKKKNAPKRAPAKPGPAAAAPKAPKPSAGKRILSHLGIDDAELAAFLPPGSPRIRAVFWCQFDAPLTHAELAACFEGRYAVAQTVENKVLPHAPPTRAEVPVVRLSVPGRYVGWVLWHTGKRWQLEAYFREMGTFWGSNQAVYELFKALELPKLRAKDVVELTE